MIDPKSNALNYVIVCGIPNPGRASISGAAVVYNWDVQPSYGMSGAVTVYKGRGISEFTLTISLWELPHFIAWPAFAKLLEPPKPGIKLVVEMIHPTLSDIDVKAVVVKSRGALERQSNGVWTSTIALMEYRPPIPALVKPRGSIPGVDKGVPIPPQTEAQKALAEQQKAFDAAKAAASTPP